MGRRTVYCHLHIVIKTENTVMAMKSWKKSVAVATSRGNALSHCMALTFRWTKSRFFFDSLVELLWQIIYLFFFFQMFHVHQVADMLSKVPITSSSNDYWSIFSQYWWKYSTENVEMERDSRAHSEDAKHSLHEWGPHVKLTDVRESKKHV